MFRIVVDQIQTQEPKYWLGNFCTCVCLDHVVWKKRGGGRFCCDFDEFLYACSISHRCFQFAQNILKKHRYVLFPPCHVLNSCTKRCVVKLKWVWNWVLKNDWTIDRRRCRRLTFEIKSFVTSGRLGAVSFMAGMKNHEWRRSWERCLKSLSHPTFSPLSCCHCPIVLMEGFSSLKCWSLECPGVNRSIVFHHILSSPAVPVWTSVEVDRHMCSSV